MSFLKTMANGRPSSDPADPLLGYSALSLFPRTVRDPSTVSKPSGEGNIESLHLYLKSKALSSPTKLQEQAKSILEGGSEILNFNFQSKMVSRDKSGSVSEKRVENPPERRPALGRKRARFSLKPDSSSQPAVIMEPSLDIDKLQDPEEYFLAHEKLENAKKELQRQQGGVLVDLNQRIISTTARHRRPGILGRSVSYKHHYSSSVSYNDENIKPCPATVGQEILSTDYSSQAELVDPNVASQERELTEMVDPNFESQERDFTVTKAENKVDEILGELLSGDCEDLDEDGALAFLQERLQIKPIDLDKLSLPELNDIQQNDFKSTGGNWLKYRDSLSDINTMLKGFSSKTPIKTGQVGESSVYPSTSPTPPKSPFASITLLKKHILQSSLTKDPYSVLKVNLSPIRNSSSVKCCDKQFDNVDIGKELSFSKKLKSVVLERDDIAVANKGLHEVVDSITGESAPPSEKAINNNSRRLLQVSPARNSSPVKYSDRQSDKIENLKELSFSERLKSVAIEGDGISVASKDSHEVVDVITRDLTPSKKVVNNNSRRLLQISPARNSSVSDKQSNKIENGKELSFSEKLKSVSLEGGSTLPSEKAVNNNSRRLLQVLPARNASVKCSDKQSDKIETGKELSFAEKLESVMLEGDDMSGANNSPHEVVDVIMGDSTPISAKAVNNSSRRRLQVSPARKLSSVKCSDKQSDKIEKENELSFSEKLKSATLEGDDIADANKSPREVVDVIIGDSTLAKAVNNSSRRRHKVSPARKFSSVKCSDKQSNKIGNGKELSFSEKAVNNSSRGLGVGTDSGLSGSRSDLDGNIRASNVIDDLRRLNADTDFQISGTNELEDKFEDMLLEAEPHARPGQNIDDSTLETMNSLEIEWDQPTTGIVDDHEREGPSKTADKDPKQCTEKIQEPSDKSPDNRSKEKTPPRRGRKRKEISGRQSLAGAGTLWNSGVRRSTRIRMRPLEYWKGERFLYGRIHQSLTTVIGVKYMSPGKDGAESTLRVKSYVSDEYKELVDLAALH